MLVQGCNIVDERLTGSSGAGQCVFRAQTTSDEAVVTWDALRAVVDILLGRCVEGSDAPGIGGIASGHDGGAGSSRGYFWPSNLVVRMVQSGLRSVNETSSVEEFTGPTVATS